MKKGSEYCPCTDIDENGECSEHKGESCFTPEEEEGWESYIENINK